jgi:predicted ATPase
MSSPDAYPWRLPVVRGLEELKFHPKVTFLIGENGTGKSTLLEGIADCAGFGEQGGSKHLNLQGTGWSALGPALKLVRGIRRERDAFFLRAESSYNVAGAIEAIARESGRGLDAYGGVMPHAQSHGEWFLAMLQYRLGGHGLYLFDEPEAALSPTRQLALLRIMRIHVEELESQFVIATHSPILMAYPDALIYELTKEGIRTVAYEETEHFLLTRDFLMNPELYLRELFAPSLDERET